MSASTDNPPLSQAGPPNANTPAPEQSTLDSQISHSNQITYWSSQSADVNGMLGGYPQVSRIDLQGSKNFIAKVRRLLSASDQSSSAPAITTLMSATGKAPAVLPKPSRSRLKLAVDCGAGIGRITSGLLLHVADTVDIVEPIQKFTDILGQLPSKPDEGVVGEIFNSGLESWQPPSNRKYDLVWNQWCLGHLTDGQLVDYLRRVTGSLVEATGDQQGGWMMVKENLSTDPVGDDIFDDEDSSVTRSDQKFRALFEEAGMKVVKMELQNGFPKDLYPVKMYALQPK